MPSIGKAVTIHKLDEDGREMWRYQGTILDQSDQQVILEAFFDRDAVEVGGLIIKRGDRFVETFYCDRWYNIFRVYDRSSGHFKGWYCNISRPAQIEPGNVFAEDLALDLVIHRDGHSEIIDQDEFQALSLCDHERTQALRALEEMQRLASSQEGPFAVDEDLGRD